MRMSREDIDSEGDIGVFHCGKRFRYSRKETVAGKEEQQRKFEESNLCAVLQITLYGERKRKERDHWYYLAE